MTHSTDTEKRRLKVKLPSLNIGNSAKPWRQPMSDKVDIEGRGTISKMKPIPINEAKKIAKNYGYDQVVIYARAVDEGGEHMTTYGKNKEHCDVAGRMAAYFQREIAGWDRAVKTERDNDKALLEEMAEALEKAGTGLFTVGIHSNPRSIMKAANEAYDTIQATLAKYRNRQS